MYPLSSSNQGGNRCFKIDKEASRSNQPRFLSVLFKWRIACMIFKLLSLFVMAVYLWGIWKFQKGYKKTNFSSSLPNRFALSLLWPALIFANRSYRKNFQKALKG